MRYWVDADVWITANRDHYPIGTAKGFWKWMDGLIADGIIVSPRRVFKEVIEGRKSDDPLLVWMNRHKGKLSLPITPEIDEIATNIGNYVWTTPRYPTQQRMVFSKGGDAWLIACAKHDKGTVLSNESDRFPKSKKVRIPDLCDVFKVRCRTMIQMIKEIPGAEF